MATKYLIFSIIFFGYAMFAYNRKGVSFTIPSLLSEGMASDHIGLILSSQNLAYAISKFLGGIISDKLSSRILFSAGLLVSGMAATLFPLVDSVTMFALIWFLNGLAQGVGWPAIAKLLKNWFEPSELGTWWSMASASANLSGCLAPFLANYIILTHGWRVSLSFVGSLTILAAAVSYMFIVDSPEATSSKKRKPVTATKGASENALKILLRTKFIWVVSICYLAVSSIKTSLTDWSQMYLMNDCHQSSLVANGFVSSVEFGGFFGGIAAGYLSDFYMKRVGATQSGHPRMKVALLFALLGIALGASVYGQIALFGVVATQSVISEMSGTSHAIAALAANVGSIVAGLPFATIAKYYSWSQVFLVLEGISIGTVAFMIVTSTISYKINLKNK